MLSIIEFRIFHLNMHLSFNLQTPFIFFRHLLLYQLHNYLPYSIQLILDLYMIFFNYKNLILHNIYSLYNLTFPKPIQNIRQHGRLNEKMGVNLTHHDVNWVYNCLHLKSMRYYLKTRVSEVILISCLPESNKGMDQDFFIISSEWHDGPHCST